VGEHCSVSDWFGVRKVQYHIGSVSERFGIREVLYQIGSGMVSISRMFRF
jgi:hypothetical protein